MQKSRRIVLIVAGVLVGIALAGYLGLRIYLGSNSAKQLAAAKLTEKFGSDVTVTELESGVSSTSVHLEVAGESAQKPLLAGVVHVDVSPIGLAAGREPQVINIANAKMNLHLDKDGNIVGKVPTPKAGGGGGKLPEINVTGAAVHFAQDGKPEFDIAGVDLQVREADGKLVITGKVQDAEWGAWTVGGDWKSDGSSGAVTMDTSAPIHLTPAKLKSIPFVPHETWENVELDGMSSGKVRIGRGADTKWNWRVECDPANTKLVVFPIDLQLTETAGHVIVDGAKVILTGVHGKAANGLVNCDATLDFGPTPSRLEFKVKATDLDVKKTPASWGVSHQVDEGRMNGSGDIVLKIADGKVLPEGRGKAVIKGKAFGGDAELDLYLRGDGKKLKFQDAPEKTLRRKEAIPDLALLELLAGVLVQAPSTQPAQPPKEPIPAEIQYVRANLKLRDVNIAELVAKANLGSPVKLAGKVTLDVSAEIPTTDPGSIKLYRATGKLSSPSLQIEDLTLAGVTADVQLRDGVLKLTKFTAEFPKGTDGKAGSFLGTASFGIDPRTDLTAELTLDTIPLGQVFAALPGLKDKADGVLSGKFDLKIPGDKLSDVKSYVAGGTLTSTGVTVYGQKAEKVALAFALKDGVAQLSKAEAGLYSGTVTGEAKLPLVGKDPGSFRINFKDLDSAALVKAIPKSPVTLAGKVNGKLDGTMPSVEGFEAAKITVDLDLASPKLVVQGLAATKLTGKLGYKPGEIPFALKGHFESGGTFDIDGTYPLGKADPKRPADKPFGGTVRIDRLRLDGLSRSMRIASLEPLRGVLSLTLRYTHGADGPRGAGRLEIRDLGWGDEFEGSDIISDIRVSGDGVDIPDISGDLAGGTLRGRVRYDFNQPRKSLLVLKLENADAATLLEPFGFKGASGRVSASIRSSIGKEFRGSGTIAATRAKISGVDVADLRVPLTFSFSPGGSAQLAVHDASGTIANGRVTGRTQVDWSGSAGVEGRVEFVDVNVADLAKGFGANSHGVGKTTGRFDFTGADVRSASDLKGTLTAKFGQTSAKELPIIGSASALLSPIQSLSQFDSGELLARLGSGSFRIERLALASPSAKLYADGIVGLNGGLDLDVIYNTSTIGPALPLRTILRNIPAIGPIPVGLIVRVTEALSNRVIRLKIGGTTRDPKVSVNAAGLFTENAVRFFAGQYVPLSTGPAR